MHNCSEAVLYFQKMFPSWHISATDSTGLLGWLVALWDPSWVSVKAFRCFAGILLEARFRGIPGNIHILNIYAPYKDRFTFSNWVFFSEMMELVSLIIVGDLNYTLSSDEVWGCGRKVDPLADPFQDALLSHNFVDICPAKIAPTWDNGRFGTTYVAKRLDHFLSHEKLIERLGDFCTEIISNFTSDHRPISLQWRNTGIRKGLPFKVNRSWLEDLEFNELVQES